MDLITTRGLSIDFVETVFKKAKGFEPVARKKTAVSDLSGKTLATLFFEPSTRTQLSFQTAMHRLGGDIIGFSDPKTTSTIKGERLSDTLRVVEGYADAIVIRHPSDGAAALAAEKVKIPVINAGDGSNQHPTQALMDLYTVLAERKTLDGLTFELIGDLRYGRTVHSLMYLLAHYNVKVLLHSPPTLSMPSWIVDEVGKKIDIKIIKELSVDADVVYATRVQQERFPDPEEYRKNLYHLDTDWVNQLKKNALLLHPLPRVNEISPEVDDNPRAKYFEQSFYGVPVRMAVLDMLVGDR
ncbi:MAG TPA: aspartate carbamoyltransferase [Candidatus Norongarragalinales archaeon]|nr:aspartate carbamoyltransferase [Candidatus Norongarragalinales archaeon]